MHDSCEKKFSRRTKNIKNPKILMSKKYDNVCPLNNETLYSETGRDWETTISVAKKA